VDLSSVQTIGSSAFYNCDRLETVILPVATSIGIGAFYNCDSLETVSLPAAESIGNNAFQNTGTTALIVTLSATPPTVGINLFTFVTAAKPVTVKVPSGATGYGTLPQTVSTDTSDCWANAFRGIGWDKDTSSYGGGTVNTYITVNIVAN
jgi:hypothetical protein